MDWAYNNLNLRFTEQTLRDFLISFNTFSPLSKGISGSSEEYKHLINRVLLDCVAYWGSTGGINALAGGIVML